MNGKLRRFIDTIILVGIGAILIGIGKPTVDINGNLFHIIDWNVLCAIGLGFVTYDLNYKQTTYN